MSILCGNLNRLLHVIIVDARNAELPGWTVTFVPRHPFFFREEPQGSDIILVSGNFGTKGVTGYGVLK